MPHYPPAAGPQYSPGLRASSLVLSSRIRDLQRNLSNVDVAADLFHLLDGPLERPCVPSWARLTVTHLTNRFARRFADVAFLLLGYLVFELTASVDVGAAIGVGALSAALARTGYGLFLARAEHACRPVAPRTAVARYLVAEAWLAAAAFADSKDDTIRRAVQWHLWRTANGCDTLDRHPGPPPADLLWAVATLQVASGRLHRVPTQPA